MVMFNGFDRQPSYEDRQHAKAYDAWFATLPKIQQDKLREEGAGPYSEAVMNDQVFPVYIHANVWSDDAPARTEREEFISREQVGVIVADVIAMLGYTNDPNVRRHWELMRLVLRAPNHLNGKEIGDMFGVSKQAICAQAKRMLAFVNRRVEQRLIPVDQVTMSDRKRTLTANRTGKVKIKNVKS